MIALVLTAVSCSYEGRFETSAAVDRESRVISTEKDGMRILVLSDLQSANIFEMAAANPALLMTVKKADPDIILTAGDNFGNDADEKHLSRFVEFCILSYTFAGDGNSGR